MADLSSCYQNAIELMRHANKRPYRHRRISAELALEDYFEEVETWLLGAPGRNAKQGTQDVRGATNDTGC